MQKTYNFISDPGHGWLEVPRRDMAVLKIDLKISTYSYMHKCNVYLEEDKDLTTFMHAAKAIGWDIKFNSVYHENTPIRNYERFIPSINGTPDGWTPESGQQVLLM